MPEQTLDILNHALNTGDCTLLVMSKPRQDVAAPFGKASLRPVFVKHRSMYQLTCHYSSRVTHENLAPSAAVARVQELLAQTFEHAALFTPTADHAFRARADGSFHVRTSPPSKAAAAAEHNRRKAYLIPDGAPCPFLTEIGVMTPAGQVRKPLYHKFRQINRFLELVNDIVPELPPGRAIEVVDFGCGKSYLTFALHYLLTEIHELSVRIVGLDRNADVVRTCAEIAGRLECRGLEFREQKIADYHAQGPVDLVVSLHACDTATDDALAQAVNWQSAVILAVPCCQHELAGQIRNPQLNPLSRHGILHERFAALATDALRSQILEICGYRTQIVEFIDLEHTAKNLLIRAIRQAEPAARRSVRLHEYEAFKSLLQIDQPALERALGSLWQ